MLPTILAHNLLVPLTDLPCVPESAFPEGLILPDSTPGAPWICRVEATVWWHRATPAAAALLDPSLPLGPRFTVGAFVTYLDTPVGPYNEILASPHLLAGAVRRGVLARVHVPFIAVDSVDSVHGGRAHWSLPKTLAVFDGSHATAPTWEVSATAAGRGPRFASYARLGSTQIDGAGLQSSSVTTARAKAQLARVDVETVSDGDLATWLVPGRHRGALLRGRMVVGRATPD